MQEFYLNLQNFKNTNNQNQISYKISIPSKQKIFS